MYGARPVAVWLGQGLQRQPRGGNVLRAVAMLPALTGKSGAGAGFDYLNGGDSRGIDHDYLVGAAPGASAARAVSQMDSRKCGRSRREPRAVLLEHQPGRSNPEQAALQRRSQREDLLTVVCDLFLTDTAAYADYVLPAASFLECDESSRSYFHHTLSAQVKAVDPPGQALRNARSSAASPPAWDSTSPSCTRATGR